MISEDAMTEAFSDDSMIPLRIQRSEMAAEGIRLFELGRGDGAPLPDFAPGAHIRVRVPSGKIRPYSLCNGPEQRASYTIAVKREEHGRGASRSLVDQAAEGDEILVSAPQNDFPLEGAPKSRLLIAGGIGITPILSMARHLAAEDKPFRLVYLTRAPEQTAFRQALAEPPFQGRVTIHHDHGDPGRAFDLWPLLEQPKGAHLYCCGPRGLMQSVRDMTGHWPDSAVHFEDFGASQALDTAADRPFAVRLAKSGRLLTVAAGDSILDTLRAAGIRVASSCESGSCGACRTALLEGEAEHRDFVLTDEERRDAIMPCVSRARSDELVLDL